jgi:competence protein ComEA
MTGRCQPPLPVWQGAMTTGIRSFLGATLPRAQQLIIFVLGLCLTGLWAWRAGLIWHPPPPPTSTHQKFFIEINGDLPRPGVHVFTSAPTRQEVWKTAGGQGTIPDNSQPLNSGTKIMITPDRAVSLEQMSGTELFTLGLTLDLNLASADDLEAIPGIGPVLAKRIIEFREKHGPLKDIEVLLNVKGVGPKKLEMIRRYVEISRIETDRAYEEE